MELSEILGNAINMTDYEIKRLLQRLAEDNKEELKKGVEEMHTQSVANATVCLIPQMETPYSERIKAQETQQRAERIRRICLEIVGENATTQTPLHRLTAFTREQQTRAEKYFTRAIEAGRMRETKQGGYIWDNAERGALAKLAYFIDNVFSPDNTKDCALNPKQRGELEILFSIKRIDRAIDQNRTGNPQKWRKQIDDTIFYD